MIDDLERIWAEISSSSVSRQEGWVRRLASRPKSFPVHAAIRCETKSECLMIDIPLAGLAALGELPATGGMSVTIQAIRGIPSNQRVLVIELAEQSFKDLFAVFCADLINRLSDCDKVNDATTILIQRLTRWQYFLSIRQEGLTHAEQVGLFGELWFLRDTLMPTVGMSMVCAWTGAQRAPQDFVIPGVCAAEVKTTEARSLQAVTINGEKQLDDTGLLRLFLVCIRLESEPHGDSLVAVIRDLRAKTAALPEIARVLERLLFDAGYMDLHAERYESMRFRVAESRVFRVRNEFPRIVPSGLVSGVGSVTYRLDLKSCDSYQCTMADLCKELAELNMPKDAQ